MSCRRLSLRRWRGLAVDDPHAADHVDAPPPRELTRSEQAAWEALTRSGLRLEQERLPWDWVHTRLEAAL